MARRTRSVPLENRTNRLRLTPRKKPYSLLLAPNIHLCYRRNKGAGTWSVDYPGGLKRFALADDHEDANGESVMDFWQAQDKARELARVGEGSTERLADVAEAIDDYAADLEARGGRKYNASQLRLHVPATLMNKTVALLSEKELRDWRNGLIKTGLKPSSADRIAKALKAALNLAASNDKRIINGRAWKHGLEPLPPSDDDDGETVRDNFILSDQVIAAIMRGCYEEGREQGNDFGAVIDVLAETGTRESQAFRLKPRDLQDDDPAAPYLLMPTSRKGSSRKRKRKTEYRPLPISSRLAKILRQLANQRAAHERLFEKIWNLSRFFRPVVQRLELDPTLTPYCLRHSSIVRQLLKGVPIRLTAANHDTSTTVIERHYARFIVSRQTDAVTRATLVDVEAVPGSNVIPMVRQN